MVKSVATVKNEVTYISQYEMLYLCVFEMLIQDQCCKLFLLVKMINLYPYHKKY